jgi:ActR/RegA family two-component response regulator
MSKDQKITKKELEAVKEQQKKIQTVVYDLGALEARKFEISGALKDFTEALNTTKKELEEKYGQVNINLEDGSYEEIVEEVSTDEAK